MPVMKRTSKKGKLQSTTEVESRGVCTSRSTRTTITPTTSTPTSVTSSTSTPTSVTSSTSTPTSVTSSTSTPTSVTSSTSTPTSITTSTSTPTSVVTSTSTTTSINNTSSNTLFNYVPSSLSSSKENPTKATYKDSPIKASHGKDSPIKASHGKDSPIKASHGKDSPIKASHGKDSPIKVSHGKDGPIKAIHGMDSSNNICNGKDMHARSPYHVKDSPTKTSHSRDKSRKDSNKDNLLRKSPKDSSGNQRSRSGHSQKRHSCQEVSPCSRAARGGPRPGDLVQAATPSVQQELLHLSLVRQALEAEKMELTRLLEQREGIITELRKQMHQRDKTIQAQRAQFEDVLRNVQNGKRVAGRGESPAGRGGVSSATKEDLQLVRDAIVSLRNNFRETDPNQHTLDTLEQAIAILIERGSGGGGSGGSSGGGGSVGGSPDKTARPVDKRLPLNGVVEVSTKVIYFTERTVTPFMSTISKRLGEIRLRDFKNMFDRPGLFRFHFKSYDPEYGLVKEEIVNEDDILPGVDGKIIAWVEEDVD